MLKVEELTEEIIWEIQLFLYRESIDKKIEPEDFKCIFINTQGYANPHIYCFLRKGDDLYLYGIWREKGLFREKPEIGGVLIEGFFFKDFCKILPELQNLEDSASGSENEIQSKSRI